MVPFPADRRGRPGLRAAHRQRWWRRLSGWLGKLPRLYFRRPARLDAHRHRLQERCADHPPYRPTSDIALVRLFRPLFASNATTTWSPKSPCPTASAIAVLGQSLDGQPIDCLAHGRRPAAGAGCIARQHPGESMAEWWMEGALECLTDPADPVARVLRRSTCRCTSCPTATPTASCRGHLRTNAAGVNLNREWAEPSAGALARSAGDPRCDGSPAASISPWTFTATRRCPMLPRRLRRHPLADQAAERFQRLRAILERRTPDFQTKSGYPVAPPGKGNLTMGTKRSPNASARGDDAGNAIQGQ